MVNFIYNPQKRARERSFGDRQKGRNPKYERLLNGCLLPEKHIENGKTLRGCIKRLLDNYMALWYHI